MKYKPIEPSHLAKVFKSTNADRVRWNVDAVSWELKEADGTWSVATWREMKHLLVEMVVRVCQKPDTAHFVQLADHLKLSMAANSPKQDELDQIQRERNNPTPIEL